MSMNDHADIQVGAPFPPDMHDARHLWLKAGLLLVWALVSFGACWWAKDLTWDMGHWEFGYWMATQGAVLIFIVIVCVYCAAMNYFERQDQRQSSESSPPSSASQTHE